MEYARPDLPYEATEAVWPSTHPDIYRHPGSLHGGNVRSKKTYHIYSLGIILAEIACWQSIQQLLMMPVDQQADIFELIKVRETVMSKNYLDAVGACAGSRYREVVRKCLTGRDDLGVAPHAIETDPVVGAAIQKTFSKQVVKELTSLCI